MDNTVTLQLVDSAALQEWPNASSGHDGSPPCLLYLVSLSRPRIRSTPTRRLRLKDSLAGGRASHNAGILARDPHFWDYLQQINLTAYDDEIDTRRARHFINRVCAVSGRHELDRKDEAGERFFRLIEKPFIDWLQNSACD